MRKMFTLLFFLSILTGFHMIQAQPVVVFSQNKCHYDRLGDLTKMMEDEGAEVLNGLVAEGKLLSWGVLQHMWGDEWNYNLYYVSPDVPTFLEAFDLYISRWREKNPEAIQSFWEMCFEHKDAIYHETVGFSSTAVGPGVKSVTLCDLPEGTSVEDVKASLEKVNAAIASIGYPGSGYSFYQVGDQEVDQYRFMVEGSWPSEQAYDKIHDSEEWKAATSEDSEMWDEILKDRLYRRFYRQ